MFNKDIKFKYSWRPYQEKVLQEANKYLVDKRINIVAAPGSGKTVLGLELVRKLGQPTLVLSPTVTIKNQWIDRFVTLFMPDNSSKPDWISDSVYHLSYFTSITYQGLHYAYKRTKLVNRKNTEETDDEIEVEKIETDVDIKAYDIIQEIKKNKISTIILDEAHHLKSEWWQSLTNILKELKGITIVSLTATPPYDIEYNEWKRYINLCGDIDMEISVPELVQAKNLCPHQDYIYFNYPTKEEKEAIDGYINDVNQFIAYLKTNTKFIEMLKNHPYILNTESYVEEILDNTELYSSMLIFLNETTENISKEKVEILGHSSKIPKLTLDWVEILVQNILFKEVKYFESFNDVISDIKKELNRIGAIEKKQVFLAKNPSLEKYFVNSISKLESINEIVKAEYSNLKQKLRMVILTDFLRKEYIFEEQLERQKIGVFPIFLNLLKQNSEMNMAVLTGSIFMIPNSKKDNLTSELLSEGLNEKDIQYVTVEKTPTYCIVKSTNKYRSIVMKGISKLFSMGKINVIIGTKSLLGEGWDEPSINSLILASFVGSYVLSNQMRGRAIRTNDNPNKTANIWHLVSVLETSKRNEKQLENTDLEMLKRRFNSFVGIGYNKNVIENGIDRLDTIPDTFTKENIDKYNQEIFEISNNRMIMYNRWFDLLRNYGGNNIKITNQIETKEENMKNKFSLIDVMSILKAILTFCILQGISLAVEDIFKTSIVGIDLLYVFLFRLIFIVGIMFVVNAKLIIRCLRAIKFSLPKNQLRSVTKVVVKSLVDAKILKTSYRNVKINIKHDKENGKIGLVLDGVTDHENNLIIKSLKEMFSCVYDQRYILVNEKRNISTYYSVPEVLASNKELATIFSKNWDKFVGNCKLVYTRSVTGRKVLLEARKRTFNYINIDKFITKKKPISK